MSSVPSTVHAPLAPRPFGSFGVVGAVRVGIAGGLLCLAMPPLFVMASTAAKFEEIFREIGVRQSPLQSVLLGVGGLMGSPLGFLSLLPLVTIGCYLLALFAIPAGTSDPARVGATGRRPSWMRIAAVVGGVAVFSVVLLMGYMVLMVGSMDSVIGKLNTPAPGTSAPSAPTPGAPMGANLDAPPGNHAHGR